MAQFWKLDVQDHGTSMVRRLLVYPHVEEGAKELSGASFIRAPPSWHDHLPKAWLLTTIIFGG